MPNWYTYSLCAVAYTSVVRVDSILCSTSRIKQVNMNFEKRLLVVAEGIDRVSCSWIVFLLSLPLPPFVHMHVYTCVCCVCAVCICVRVLVYVCACAKYRMRVSSTCYEAALLYISRFELLLRQFPSVLTLRVCHFWKLTFRSCFLMKPSVAHLTSFRQRSSLFDIKNLTNAKESKNSKVFVSTVP